MIGIGEQGRSEHLTLEGGFQAFLLRLWDLGGDLGKAWTWAPCLMLG